MSKEIIRLVDVETIERQMGDPQMPEETVEELYRFGTMALTESQQRLSRLDVKSVSILGWSTASMALLFAGSMHAGTLGRIAGLVLFLAAVIAFVALKTKMVAAPSERDWFKEKLWNTSKRMKQYHIVSMLVAHQNCVKHGVFKANCLKFSEPLFGVGTLLVVAILFLR